MRWFRSNDSTACTNALVGEIHTLHEAVSLMKTERDEHRARLMMIANIAIKGRASIHWDDVAVAVERLAKERDSIREENNQLRKQFDAVSVIRVQSFFTLSRIAQIVGSGSLNPENQDVKLIAAVYDLVAERDALKSGRNPLKVPYDIICEALEKVTAERDAIAQEPATATAERDRLRRQVNILLGSTFTKEDRDAWIKGEMQA